MSASPAPDTRPEISVVMPVYNARRYLEQTAPALAGAVRRHGDAELLFVDNGSDDGGFEFLTQHYGRDATVVREPESQVGGVRNAGASRARGRFLAFVDADCLVGPDYLIEARRVLEDTGAAATGSRYVLPEQPRWIERTWESLHGKAGDGPARYINAGNFVIRRDAFDAVGGFDPKLVTGEDAELGARLRAAGYALYESGRVRAVHLGNPKTLGQFFRRERWHGIGAFGTARHDLLDKPLLMTLAFGLCLVAAVLRLVLPVGEARGDSFLGRFIQALGLVVAVPVLTVIYRGIEGGGTARLRWPAQALLLYTIYYLGRLAALFHLARIRSGTGPSRFPWAQRRS